jgi:hypothetical protein
MGQQDSKISHTDYCDMFLETENAYYTPGDTVTGNVYLDVKRSFPAYMLELRIKGTEKVHWEESKVQTQQSEPGQPMKDPNATTSSQPSEIVNLIFKDKRKIFDVYTPIYNFADRFINPGNYTFPFTFILSDYCPGTFYINHGFHKGKIRYSMAALLRSSAHDMKDQKYKTHLVVRQKPKQVIYNQTYTSEESPCVCCCSKGVSRIEGSFERDAYVPGERANMLVKVDNTRCSLNISQIQCKLVQAISFRAQKGSMSNINKTVAEENYDGVAAGQEIAQPKPLSLELVDKYQKYQKHDKDDYANTLQPSVYGTLINSAYTLYVKTIFEGCCMCCGPSPNLSMPLYIYAPPLPNWGKIQPPPQWNPIMYEPQKILLPAGGMRASVHVPSVQVTMNVPGMQITSNTAAAGMAPVQMDVNMPIPQMQVQVNEGGIQQRVDLDMGMPNVQMDVNVSGNATQETVNMNMPGMQVNMNYQMDH